MMIAPHIVNRPDLDPLKVLAPVAATGRVSLYVIAHPEQPFKNLNEFLAYARANPGKLNYGTPGNGTSPHIATEVFNREAKVKLNHVPYKGAGPALQDLMGGQIQVVFDPGVGIAPAKAGKVRMIAIAGPGAAPGLPGRADARGERHPGRRRRPALRLLRAERHLPRDAVTESTRKSRRRCSTRRCASASRRSRWTSPSRCRPSSSPRTCAAEHARYAKLIPELGIKGGS